jgi:hypothetical protein
MTLRQMKKIINLLGLDPVDFKKINPVQFEAELIEYYKSFLF